MKRSKNNSGATILMALLLILLATAVGAAVLTAAVSAARHLRSDREAQQNYLTVSSAAEMIRDSINGQTYERALSEIHTFKEKEDGGVEETISRSVQMTPSDGKFKGVMGKWLSACIVDGGNTAKGFASFAACSDTIIVILDDDTANLKKVKAVFSAVPGEDTGEREYAYSNIQVELSLESEDANADNCHMTLAIKGTLTKKKNSGVWNTAGTAYSDIFTTTVTWGSPTITKGIGRQAYEQAEN